MFISQKLKPKLRELYSLLGSGEKQELADKVPCSRQTVYNQFRNKVDYINDNLIEYALDMLSMREPQTSLKLRKKIERIVSETKLPA